MAIQLTTRSKALNVWTADELSYGRIAPSGSVPSDIDFKFRYGDGFVAVTRLAHYHLGSRYVLGDQLDGMVTATAAEATRAAATEQKLSSDLSAEAKRATDAEAKAASTWPPRFPAPIRPKSLSWTLCPPRRSHDKMRTPRQPPL